MNGAASRARVAFLLLEPFVDATSVELVIARESSDSAAFAELSHAYDACVIVCWICQIKHSGFRVLWGSPLAYRVTALVRGPRLVLLGPCDFLAILLKHASLSLAAGTAFNLCFSVAATRGPTVALARVASHFLFLNPDFLCSRGGSIAFVVMSLFLCSDSCV